MISHSSVSAPEPFHGHPATHARLRIVNFPQCGDVHGGGHGFPSAPQGGCGIETGSRALDPQKDAPGTHVPAHRYPCGSPPDPPPPGPASAPRPGSPSHLPQHPGKGHEQLEITYEHSLRSRAGQGYCSLPCRDSRISPDPNPCLTRCLFRLPGNKDSSFKQEENVFFTKIGGTLKYSVRRGPQRVQ